VKFDDDRLRNEKALVLSITSRRRSRTLLALGDPFPGLKCGRMTSPRVVDPAPLHPDLHFSVVNMADRLNIINVPHFTKFALALSEKSQSNEQTDQPTNSRDRNVTDRKQAGLTHRGTSVQAASACDGAR